MAGPIYSATNRIRFVDIPEKYAIPRQYRAKQSEVHTYVVIYAAEHYKDTRRFRQKVVDALNYLTYCIIQNSPPPMEWRPADPLNTMPEVDMDEVKEAINSFYLTPEAIEWDLVPKDDDELDLRSPLLTIATPATPVPKEDKIVEPKPAPSVINRPLQEIRREQPREVKKSTFATPKEDLYIQPPKCPRFDVNKVWMAQVVGGDNLVIYTTLPEIPARQNEISITTNLAQMTNEELMRLYPNQIIRTRHPNLYEHCKDIEYDEDLGCIIPIEGFTHDQVVDNIIRYPHLFRLRKEGVNGGEPTKFFSSIEIAGELIPIEEAWDQLPEAKVIPRDPEFVKEYVIRRYLLEKDRGIPHKYNIVGSLDPFLTLFMPFTRYIERGYTDVMGMAKQCVAGRIRYKQTRSPILRRIEEARKNA